MDCIFYKATNRLAYVQFCYLNVETMDITAKALYAISVALLTSCASNYEPRWGNQFYSMINDERELTTLEQDITKADYEYHYDGDNKLINLGRPPQPYDGVILTLNQPSGFSLNKDSSGFVVVQLHKLAQIDSVQSKVDRINEYFFTRGADRVLVTGFRGSGRQVYSDKDKVQHFSKPPKSDDLKRGVPALFREEKFDSRSLALAANYYVSMGRSKAIRELKSLEQDSMTAFRSKVNRNYRIGWLCRILFRSKDGVPLRPPGFGGLVSLPHHTMPLKHWPHYPLVESNGVYFVLSSGYALAGVPEAASDYVDYCSKNGIFLSNKLRVPTATTATKAIDTLKKSNRWKALKWKDKRQGSSYTLSEHWVLSDIQKQVLEVK